MDTKHDHNAQTLTIEQSTHSVIVLKALRMLLKSIEHTIRAIPYAGADLTLALRHVEDARMRCGKALEPFETGFFSTDNPNDNSLAAVNSVVTLLQKEEGMKTYAPRTTMI